MSAVNPTFSSICAGQSLEPALGDVPGSTRWIELANTIQRLAAVRTLDEVVEVVRDNARRLVGADGVSFVLREEGFCHYVAEDAAAPLWSGQRFPAASCVSGWAMEHGRTAVIPDVYDDSRVPHEAYRPTFVRSMVVVPILGGADESGIAAIGAYWAEPRDPKPDEVALMEALARSSATAIANTRLLASLQASDALNRAVVEATPECIKIVAADGRLLQMNGAGLQMIEAKDAVSVHQACTFDLIAPEHRERWREMHKRVCAGEHLAWEFDIIGLAGGRRRMETHAAPLTLPDGSVAQLAVTRDVTARAQAENALRSERDRSRAVLDNLGDGYVLVDRDFRVVEINPAGLAIEQRPADEIVGKTFWEAWPGVEGSEAGRLWKEAMAERAPRSFEHRYVWPNGRGAWLEIRAFPADQGLAFFFRDVGERKAAEWALRDSEARLRQALEAGRMVAWDEDLATGISHRSGNAVALLGIETGPADDFYALIHPDDHDRIAVMRDAALGGMGEYNAEFRIVVLGREFWVVDRAHIERDGTGRPVRMFGIIADITTRKAAEIAAARAAAEFEALAENVSQLAWMAEPDGHIFWYNKRWYDYTGTTLEEMQGWGWRDVHHPDHIERVIEEVGANWAQGEPWEGTYLLRGRDGVYRPFLTRAEPIRDNSGRLIRWFGTNTDISAQREAEARVRRVLDQLFAFVGVTTTDGTLIEVNRAPLEAAGITSEEVMGKPFWATYWWSYDEQVQARVKESVARAAGGEVVRYDVLVRLARGELVTIDFQIAPLRDGEGRITHLIPSGTVVEERVRAQDELQQLNATLESRVEQEVAERAKTEEALRQAQKMEAMGQLTGGVAHDFNNLLTPIVGTLDLLQRRGVGGEREQRLIAGAVQSADRATTLVQRLLAFARRQPLQAVPVDVAKLVTNMADLIGSTTGPQIRVVVETSGHLPPAKADPNQLEMALLNLGVNARDAMPDGGTLRISVASEAVRPGHPSKLRRGHYIRLSVSDTGVGMDEATMARAVEPFFSTKGIGKGTGLGLSMVHGLAAQLGGALTIQSRPGLGTNVELWLPQSTVAPEPVVAGPDEAFKPEVLGKALLVDDEDLVRLSTADMLSDLGYRVIEATSAEEAMRLLREGERFDLLVTDHLMPGMNGTDLARAVQTNRPGLPVLLVSGYAEADGIEAGLPRLTKPFKKDELAKCLAEITSSG